MQDKAALFIKALRSLAPSSKQKVILELIWNVFNISIQCVVHLAYDVKPIFNHHMNNCVDRALGGRMNHKNSECKHEETAGCVWPLIVNQSFFVSICLFLSCLCAQTAQWQVMRFTKKYKLYQNYHWNRQVSLSSPTFLLHFGQSAGSGRGRSPSDSVRLVWLERWIVPNTGDSLQSAEPTCAVSSPAICTNSDNVGLVQQLLHIVLNVWVEETHQFLWTAELIFFY